MTIIVTIKVTDGIVLASDSAATFFDQDGTTIKVYNNANKVFNLVKGLPIGAMTFGNGNIGSASIATISKDLRRHFNDENSPYHFDHANYSIAEVADLARRYFNEKMSAAYPQGAENYYMEYWICGYGAKDESAQVLPLIVGAKEALQLSPLYAENMYGPR